MAQRIVGGLGSCRLFIDATAGNGKRLRGLLAISTDDDYRTQPVSRE
jgi:hypothetical protein